MSTIKETWNNLKGPASGTCGNCMYSLTNITNCVQNGCIEPKYIKKMSFCSTGNNYKDWKWDGKKF